jgi:hypothetical protein
MFLAWFPGVPKRLGAQPIYALMDEALMTYGRDGALEDLGPA